MPYPGPNVGPPVDYPRTPGGSDSFATVLVHALTTPGNNVTKPGDWLHALMHPRAALGAGLQSPFGTLAQILVPGARGKFGEGVPTAAQQRFLDAIQGSSYRPRDFIPPIGTANLFQENDPGVQALARQLGMPRSTLARGQHERSAISPLSSMLSRQGEGNLGLHPDTNRLSWSRTTAAGNLFGKQSGPPNQNTLEWLRGLLKAINMGR